MTERKVKVTFEMTEDDAATLIMAIDKEIGSRHRVIRREKCNPINDITYYRKQIVSLQYYKQVIAMSMKPNG